MSTQTISQQLLRYQKTVSDLQQENALLKIRLSELVDESVMSDFLEKAEHMYAELITNDESLKLLMASANFIQAEINNDDTPCLNPFTEKLNRLSTDLQRIQIRFDNLKSRFGKEFLLA